MPLVLQLVKFIGCYHGHADSFLVQAGSGVATLGLPDSPGVPSSSTGVQTCLQTCSLDTSATPQAVLASHAIGSRAAARLMSGASLALLRGAEGQLA